MRRWQRDPRRRSRRQHDGTSDAMADVGPSDAAIDASLPTFTCTQHVTTSTFKAAFTAAGPGVCLAPGNYGNWTGGMKTSMVGRDTK